MIHRFLGQKQWQFNSSTITRKLNNAPTLLHFAATSVPLPKAQPTLPLSLNPIPLLATELRCQGAQMANSLVAVRDITPPTSASSHCMTWAAAQHELAPRQWAAAYLASLGQVFPDLTQPWATESIGAGSDIERNASTVQLALSQRPPTAKTNGLMSFATTCPYLIPDAVSFAGLLQADAALRAPMPTTLAAAAQCGRTCGLTSKAVMSSRTPCLRMLLHPETSSVISNVSASGLWQSSFA